MCLWCSSYAIQQHYLLATRAEVRRDFNVAFKLYIKAANLFLTLSHSTAESEARRILWRKEAAKAVERAEKIKVNKKDLEPVITDKFAKGE